MKSGVPSSWDAILEVFVFEQVQKSELLQYLTKKCKEASSHHQLAEYQYHQSYEIYVQIFCLQFVFLCISDFCSCIF